MKITKKQLKPLIKQILKEMYFKESDNNSGVLEDYFIEEIPVIIPGISDKNSLITITLDIEYNITSGQPASGKYGQPDKFDPGEGDSVEIISNEVTGMKVYDGQGNVMDIDPSKLSPQQQIPLKKAIEQRITLELPDIEEQILQKSNNGSVEQ